MPVRLVDLRAAQSQWARGYRRSRWLEHGTSVLLVGTFALNFAIASSAAGQGVGETHYRLSLIFLGVALVVLLVTTWVAPALWRLRDRRGPGLASPGPSSTGEVRSNAPGPEIWAATRAALERAGYQPPWLLDRHTMESRRSRRWGGSYFVTVRVVGTAVGGARVSVWARPETSMWGRRTPVSGWPRLDANAVLLSVPGRSDSTGAGAVTRAGGGSD